MNNDNTRIDNFSFGRLGLLLNKDMLTRRRSLMLQLLLVVGAMTILAIFVAIGVNPFEPYAFNRIHVLMTLIFLVAFSAYTMVGASLSFSSTLGTKADRALSLMEPATTMERFLARALPGVLLPPVFVVVGQCVAEAVRALLASMIHHGPFQYDPMSFMSFSSSIYGEGGGWLIAIICCSYGMTQAFYLLGSVVWPRLSFIKTFAAIQIIGAVQMMLLMALSIGNMIFEAGIGSMTPRQLAAMVCIGSVLFSAAAIIIAYYRYREIEIVQRW